MKFVFETTFISEQIAENRFGALLEISDKFITKLNVFSYMILQFLLERPQFASQKLEMKLLGMGKDMKIKHGVPPPQHTHTHTHTHKLRGGIFY